MSNLFSKLFEEGERQQQQLQQEVTAVVMEQEATAVPVASHPPDSMTARQHTVPTTRHQPVQTVTTVEQHDSRTARQQDGILNDTIQAFLKAKATNKTTLRYPPSLFEAMDDLLYQIKKTHGIVLSKNAVFVLALAYILDDYQRQGRDSLLFKALLSQRK